jgi:hypothetical protein
MQELPAQWFREEGGVCWETTQSATRHTTPFGTSFCSLVWGREETAHCALSHPQAVTLTSDSHHSSAILEISTTVEEKGARPPHMSTAVIHPFQTIPPSTVKSQKDTG